MIIFVCSPQILHNHCFQFLLGLTMVPRENKNNAYSKFGETNKEYYGIFRSGLFRLRPGGWLLMLRHLCHFGKQTIDLSLAVFARLPGFVGSIFHKWHGRPLRILLWLILEKLHAMERSFGMKITKTYINDERVVCTKVSKHRSSLSRQ